MSAGFLISDIGIDKTASYFDLTREQVLAMMAGGATTSDDIYRLKKAGKELRELIEMAKTPDSGSPNYLPNGVPQPKKEKSQWGRKWF
jgi:hypothetical protein